MVLDSFRTKSTKLELETDINHGFSNLLKSEAKKSLQVLKAID